MCHPKQRLKKMKQKIRRQEVQKSHTLLEFPFWTGNGRLWLLKFSFLSEVLLVPYFPLKLNRMKYRWLFGNSSLPSDQSLQVGLLAKWSKTSRDKQSARSSAEGDRHEDESKRKKNVIADGLFTVWSKNYKSSNREEQGKMEKEISQKPRSWGQTPLPNTIHLLSYCLLLSVHTSIYPISCLV